MKAIIVIAALLVAGGIGYQMGQYAGLETGRRDGVIQGYSDGIKVTHRKPGVTLAQWEKAYESGWNVPYCYGHPHNREEMDLIWQFNSDEAVARNHAYDIGEIQGE